MKVRLRGGLNLQAENLTGWLRPETVYCVLSVEQYDGQSLGLRIASDDSMLPVVFRAALFDIVDSTLPRAWRALALRKATLDIGPLEFSAIDFWERVFDRDPDAWSTYLAVKGRIEAEG